MAYADYDYYSATYKGTLPEADFERLSERASDYIDGRTDYVLKKAGVPEELLERVKKACCALAETMGQNESGGGKTSEKVGNYSVSFSSVSSRSAEQKLDDAIMLYIPDLVKAVQWI